MQPLFTTQQIKDQVEKDFMIDSKRVILKRISRKEEKKKEYLDPRFMDVQEYYGA